MASQKPFQFSLAHIFWLMIPMAVIGWAIHWSGRDASIGPASWVIVGVVFFVSTFFYHPVDRNTYYHTITVLTGINPTYPGKVERAIVFTVEAYDVNCPQHIHKRYSQRQVAPVIEQLRQRVSALEAELADLRRS